MEDKRCKHSKQRLRQALINCLLESNIEEVTIKELCANADVNRTTFYAHYTDINSLYLEVQGEAIAELEKHYQKARQNITTYRTMLFSIFQYIDEHSDIILMLLKTNSSAFKETNMKALSIFERSDETPDQVAFEYAEEFLLSGAHSMIQKWIERGKKENVEYMADLLYQMTKNIKQK